MKNNIMTFVEIDTMSRNLNMLEARLGYPAPRHLLNSDDLKDGIMSLEEVDTTARNIELINMRRNGIYGTRKANLPLLLECWPIFFILFLVLVVIVGMLGGY